MRSSQADAARLDDELATILREQFMKSFSLFQQTSVSQYQPELMLVLEFLIFKFSIWDGRPLPGMALMNLRHRDERSHNSAARSNSNSNGGTNGVDGPGLSTVQRSLYCLGSIFLRYVWTKASRAVTRQHWSTSNSMHTTPSTNTRAGDNNNTAARSTINWQNEAWKAMNTLESIYVTASFFNFLAFLRTGKYRSLLERLLQARLVYAHPSAARAISYEYLNRQLVWSELSDFLLFLVPLVNIAAVKRTLRTIFPRLSSLRRKNIMPFISSSHPSSSQQQQEEQEEDCDAMKDNSNRSTNNNRSNHMMSEPDIHLLDAPCPLCPTQKQMILPYRAHPCNHIFCYYCLRSQTLADASFECPLCFVQVEAISPALRPL